MISINSLNGKFNWSFDVFAESLLKHPSGSIGVIASTMNLDPVVPAFYFIALMDGLCEEFLPDVGQSANYQNFTLPSFANAAAKYYISSLKIQSKQFIRFIILENHFVQSSMSSLLKWK